MRAPEPTIVLVLGAWRPQMFSDYLPQSYLSRMVGIKEWLPPHNEAAWMPIQGNDPLFKSGFGVVGDNLMFDRSDIWSRGEQFVNCLPADSPYPVAHILVIPRCWRRPQLAIGFLDLKAKLLLALPLPTASLRVCSVWCYPYLRFRRQSIARLR